MSTAPTPSQDPPSSLRISPETLYTTLTAFLSTHTSSTLSVEILPSSHSHGILHDGLNLAIPKKALIQCFLIARTTLLSTLSISSHPPNPGHNFPDTPSVDLATEIILLYDPEHLSAANWRKRNLTALSIACMPTSSEPQPIEQEDRRARYQRAVEAEQSFLTTLLTSPLPKHPKSPTLWSHRYWLLKSQLSLLSPSPTPSPHNPNPPRTPISAFIRSELTTILSAASRHKSNYHAFHYGRRLLSLLSPSSPPTHPSLPDPFFILSSAELEDVVQEVRKWCLAHPRDISGWGFLAWLLRWGVEGKEGTGDTHWRDVVYREVKKVEEFVRRVGWKGASVEWFLREVGQVGVGKGVELVG
ncbi:hypothetical protein MMC30_003289 [Trapelia coarctata]|nr:hypothetical protein [Trapelia coarctata]